MHQVNLDIHSEFHKWIFWSSSASSSDLVCADNIIVVLAAKCFSVRLIDQCTKNYRNNIILLYIDINIDNRFKQ